MGNTLPKLRLGRVTYCRTRSPDNSDHVHEKGMHPKSRILLAIYDIVQSFGMLHTEEEMDSVSVAPQ